MRLQYPARTAVRRSLALAAALALASGLSACGSDPPDAASTVRTAETPSPPATTALGPAPRVTPPAIPGYLVTEVGIGSFRESNVFRLRNALLNGLEGGASTYSFTTHEARRRGSTALLFGVSVRRGAAVPDLPPAIDELIAPEPAARGQACGRAVSFHGVAEGQTLAVLDVDARRALVVLTTGRAAARPLVAAAAAAIIGCP